MRFTSVPSGRLIVIDGQNYTTPQAFQWPKGSCHTLSVLSPQYDVHNDAQFTLGAIVTNLGGPAQNTICVDPKLTEVFVNFSVTYKVYVSYYDCSGYSDVDGRPCPASLSPGTVYVGGTKLTMSGVLYLAPGLVTLQAFPNLDPLDDGLQKWIFDGWYIPPATSPAFISTFLVTGPLAVTLTPRFIQARRVNILSTPPGLKLVADRAIVITPHAVAWGWNSTHTLSTVHDQNDSAGKLWIFDKWDDNGAETHAYTVAPQGGPPATVNAIFTKGERVSFLTSPAGNDLKLTVEGRSSWPNGYNFNWAIGSTHTASAPATQVDASGRTWNFKSWSNGSTALTQTVFVPDTNGDGTRLTANFELQGGLTLLSSTPGASLLVDGQACGLPCNVVRPIGTSVRLSVPASLRVNDDSRYDFQGWSDGGETERTVTLPGTPLNLTFLYQLRNRLSVTATAPEGLRVNLDPVSADGFYDSQSQVQILAETKAGFKFRNWEGDISGTSRQVSLAMASPKFIRAVLDRVPAVVEDGVRNAASGEPGDGVAAGSIVSISGFNLAPAYTAGPEAPLVQALADVTVTVNGRLLPLFFVSPEQINVQLPYDLSEGQYKLSVKWEGKPEITADFHIVRNAPGLFNRLVEGRAYALALHQNGDAVTADSPASRGETLTLLANGVGPMLLNPPDGFAAPDSANYRLVDPVAIFNGETRLEPQWAGAAAGRIGMTAIRFVVDETLPHNETVAIRIRVNGRDSNTVLLPLE